MKSNKDEWTNASPQNCGDKLKLVREIVGVSRKELANALGVAESSIYRLEVGETDPSSKFLERLRALLAIGYANFSTMSEEDISKWGEYIGAGSGVAAGIGGAVTAVSTAGAVGGLSAAGITSGLAAIGGGTMLGGVAAVAVIPVVAGLAGFGLARGIRAICKANNLDVQEIDKQWEIKPKSNNEEGRKP